MRYKPSTSVKKNVWSPILLLTVAYSFLFYRENAGVNFLLFTVCLGIGFIYLNVQLIKNPKWLLFFSASLFSAIFIFVHSSNLAIFAWCLSILLTIANGAENKSSLLFNLLHGAFHIISALPLIFIRRIHPEIISEPVPTGFRRESFVVYSVIGVLIVTFLIIYKSINPLFEKYTEAINLNFITVNWLLFTSGGFILVYGFIRGKRIPKLDEWESKQQQTKEEVGVNEFKPLYLKAFIILFAVLNLLLVFINILDVQYLYLGHGMPAGITHKQFVHNGVGTLNLSILLGVALILYAFSNKLQFQGHDKILRSLVFFWLIQNVFMIVSTGIRNKMYIQEALLTYKRLLVFYWLGLSACLLITTFLRVRKNQSNWGLINTNSLVAYLMLMFTIVLDWDLLISDYNYARIKDIAGLDKKYLIALSEGNIPLLYAIKNHPKFEIDSAYHYRSGYFNSNKSGLDAKLYNFLYRCKEKSWKSYSYRASKTLKNIYQLDEKQLFDTLNLTAINPVDFSCLDRLKNVKMMNLYTLNSLTEKDIQRIENFPKLECISVEYASRLDSMQIRGFKKLKKLTIKRFYTRQDSIFILKMKISYRLELSQKSNTAL